MNAQDALKLARRFIELPLQKRQLFIKGLRQEGVEFSVFPIPQGVAAEDRDALSYAQQRMWFLWQLDPQSAAYNLPGAVRLRGHLDEAAVEQAFVSLIERHETLRTVFERRSDDSLHQVPCEAPLVIKRADFSELPVAEREARVLDEARQQAARPFDLGRGPLLRVKLLKLAAEEHVLLLTLHHIVSDGWSMNVLIDEFTGFYDAHQQGRVAQLPPLTIQYSDYALWQRRWLEAGEQARQLEYWQAQLGDEHPPLELPLDHPRPAVSSYRGVRHEFAVDHQLVEQLRGLAQRHNITLFMLLLGSFNVLLHRYTGQSDIRVGVPIANRNRSEVEGLIGFFVNTQVLRTRLDGQSRVSDVLQAIKQAALGAQAHQDLPFERLVEALKLERSLSHTPLFQVMYNHQPQVADISSIKTASGLSLELVENQGRSTQFDLTLDTWEKGARLHAALTYASDLFEPETIQRMARHWLNLLQAIVRDPQQCVGELSMLDASEYQTLIHEWNNNAFDCPNSQCIHELIAGQVAARPDELALIDGEQHLSYQQLDSRANQLAHKLIELGIGPEVRVGVAMARSSELIVALLAVLKAGGAYVPLDPQYPAERVAYMLEDSQALVLLTETGVLAGLPATQATVVLLDHAKWLTGYPATAPVLKLSAQNLAYVIYTSGSTGKPKGVAIAHRNVAALIQWSQQVYSREDLQGVLASTSVCFDLSVWEIFVTLASGGFIVLAGNALELPELPARDRVRLINSVPSAITGLQRLGQIPPSVRIINLAGEPLKQALVEALYQLPHIDHVYDLYGPSEDTTYSTWTRRTAGGTANIGRPLSNTRSYLLDGDLQPVPIGVPAELYLAGAGITRGYLLRPGLTAERFVPDPFSTSGGRLYRTGDLARYRADGVIEYIGRIDHQIKLRGFRIELGEIEARLVQHPEVKDAVVLVHEGKTLVTYVVAHQEPDNAQALNQQLKNHVLLTLPDYMTPSVFVQLEQLPTTPNGKLDRKALPAPDAQQALVFSAPQSHREIVLAEIWQQLLGLDQVGLDDNFFELGGDSIVSIQVVSRARQAGLSLTPRDLFQYQTLRALAEVAVAEQAPLVNRETVSGEVLLTPIQHWFFQQPIPQREHWNQAVLLRAQQVVDVPALTQALDWLVQQHDALRLRFSGNAEGWQQRYADRAPMELWHRTADSADQLREHCNVAQASLDLQDGPLLRALLVDMADGSQRLLLVVHHLAVDGVSWRVLLEDLQQAYARLQRGEALIAEHKTSSYQQWATRLAEYANSPELLKERHYWQAQAQDTLPDLPRDNTEGRQTNAQASRVRWSLDAQHTRQLLQQAPTAYRTQVNDLLLTALSRVICRWTGHDATLIQLEGHGREQLFDDVDLTRTVGWFTSLYPLRLVPVSDVAGSIKAIKEQLRSVPTKGVGYGILRYLAAGMSLETAAQPRITFNYLGQFDQQFSEDAVFAPAIEGSGEGQSRQAPLANWLSIEGQVSGGELLMDWNFSHEVFEAATIQRLVDAYAEELKGLIEHCCDTQNRGVTPADFPLARLTQHQLDQLPLPAEQIEDIYPLSPMQQGMLFHFQYTPDTRHYINQMRLDIEGVDPERFRQAWQAALDAHPILRTQFLWQGDLAQPLQLVRKQLSVPFMEHDWRARTDLPEALNALADSDQQPFDLSQAPLMRVQLVRTGPTHYHLIYTHHHILLDGWSNTQLLGEILQRYHGGFQSVASAGYADYIGWLQVQDPNLSEAFWRAQLAELAEPTQLAQSLTTEVVGQHADHYKSLDIEQTRRLSEFARHQKVTVNTLLQAAWLLLLQRYTGQASVCFGATVSGRPGHLRGIEQQLGLFINTLPVIATPRAEQQLGDWLQQLQTLNLNLREHEYTPLAEIQRWAQLEGGSLFDTLLVFENYPISAALEQGAGEQLRFGEVRNSEQAHYPLTLAIGLGEQLSLHYSYALGAFDEALIRQIDGHLRALLVGMVEQPDALLGNLGFDQQAILEQWNPHRIRFNIEHSLAQRIEAQVERSPEAIALSFDGEQLTYAELNQQANRVAHQLIARGVGPEVRVGLAVERGLEMIVGLLAILKAGGAYVPLDPAYPQDRLSYMIKDSGIGLLLAQAGVLEALPLGDGVEILLICSSTDTPPRGQARSYRAMHSSSDTPPTGRSALARDSVKSGNVAATDTLQTCRS
ncbi:amino acid adenylation domain-containing protein, partial [Pseudomonas caspiana]